MSVVPKSRQQRRVNIEDLISRGRCCRDAVSPGVTSKYQPLTDYEAQRRGGER